MTNAPLRVWLDQSVSKALTELTTRNPQQFQLVADPSVSDVIIFEDDNPGYIRRSLAFKKWPDKCVVVSEQDRPGYFLPACYASNQRCLLSKGRSKTIPFIISETAIPNPFIKDIEDIEPRPYLYSFRGGSTSWVRKKLFKSPPKKNDVLIEESNHYFHWNNEDSYLNQKLNLQKEYAKILEKSFFFLCPRGVGSSSIRLFEVMKAGRIPVIVSDDWIPVEGIPWNEFSIRVRERDISKIDSIIRSHSHSARELGRKAKQAWKDFCAPGMDSILLADALREIQHARTKTLEAAIRLIFPLFEVKSTIKTKTFAFLKYSILLAFKMMGRKFPYSLNRPIEDQLHKPGI